jgi:hypothetical protein
MVLALSYVTLIQSSFTTPLQDQQQYVAATLAAAVSSSDAVHAALRESQVCPAN